MSKQQSPVHTKNNNYKDNDISNHTSKQYHLFILSAYSSAALNSRARYSRMDSDWVSMFKKKKVQKVIPTILFLCAFIVIAVVWTRFFELSIFVLSLFIVIVIGVNRP